MSKHGDAGLPSVDTHFHVFARSAPVVADARYRPAYDATLQAWRALASAAGVVRGVVVQPSFLGSDNGQLLDALADGGDTLRGVAALDPDTRTAELPSLHRAGVRGFRWNLVGRRDDARERHAGWRALALQAHTLGWHLELHTDPGRLPDALALLPEAPIAVVVDHFGRLPLKPAQWRESFAAVERASRARDVYVKLSAPYRSPGLDRRAAARAWLAAVGEHRLLWGSDWPWTNHEHGQDYSALARRLGDWLGDEVGAAAIDRNAERLFGWDADSGA